MSEMEIILDRFPSQLLESINFTNIKTENPFKNIIVNGMGGSALPANLLRIYLHELMKDRDDYISIYNNRTYYLPKEADSNSLILCCSYSGNTEETIAAYNESKRKNLNIVGISAGGKIEEMCQRDGVPHIKLPQGIQPRMSTGYFFGAILKLLINSNFLPLSVEQVLQEASENLVNVGPELKARGRIVASRLKNRIPLIYSSTKWKSMAMIWKINFNENSKIQSFFNYFPELNHNEMEGFTNLLGNYYIIILRDENDSLRKHKRMEVFKNLMQEQNIPTEIIDFYSGTTPYKIFTSQLLSFWTSYYLSKEYGIDPVPVNTVEKFKKLLGD